MALSTADARIIDIVAASCIRGLSSYLGARFLEGWGTASSATATSWAAGLGKLGGVGGRLVEASSGRTERVERETKLREIRRKGCLTEPPQDGKELGERILLLSVVKAFRCEANDEISWTVFLRDKASSIGWSS